MLDKELTDEMVAMIKKNQEVVMPYVFNKNFVCLDLVTDATKMSKTQKYIRATYIKWREKEQGTCESPDLSEREMPNSKSVRVVIGDKAKMAKYIPLKHAIEFLPTLFGFKKHVNLMNILQNKVVQADCVHQIDESEEGNDMQVVDVSAMLSMLTSIKKITEQQQKQLLVQMGKILELEECIMKVNKGMERTRAPSKRKRIDELNYAEASSNARHSIPPRRCKSRGCTSHAKDCESFCEAHLLIKGIELRTS